LRERHAQDQLRRRRGRMAGMNGLISGDASFS
jgi:hypothetical protein